MLNQPPRLGRRIALFSRYCLADQYDLAAEFKSMLQQLGSRHTVLHLSLRGTRRVDEPPAGVTVEEVPPMIRRDSARDILWKSLWLYACLPAFALRLRRFKPDIIFLTEILPLAGLFLKWFTGAKVATAYGDWHVHNFLGRKKWTRFLLRAVESMDRFEVRRLDGIFCRAATAGLRVKEWGMPEDRVCVVRDAPDPDAFFPRDMSPLRQRLGFQAEDVVLLYHGVMHAGKGLDKLIAWSAELYREEPRLGLILVGGGPEAEALRRQAAATPFGQRVHFTGWLKTVREVGDYCNAADICIAMRTKAEANERVVPGALLHSMACGKVVIGPRLSGIAEILREGENGYMFTADDGTDFQRLMRRLIADRSLWEPVAAKACLDIEQKYSVAASAANYAKALEHFADDYQRGGRT